MRLPSSLKARITLLVVIPLAVQLGLLARLTYIQTQAESAVKNAERYSDVVRALNDLNQQCFHLIETFYATKLDMQNAKTVVHAVTQTVHGFDRSIENLQSLTKEDPDVDRVLKQCVDLKEELVSTVRTMGKSMLSPLSSSDDERKQLNRRFLELARGAVATLPEMEMSVQRLADAKYKKGLELKSEERYLIVGFGVLAAVLGLVAAAAMSNDASQKLGSLRRNVANLAAGADLDAPIAGSDEIAVIDRSFFETALALRRAQANQRELVSMFTHDMRNPLTAMNLSLDSLAEKPDLQPYTNKITQLQNNSRRMSVLIADLLDLYKSESGMMHFAHEKFSLTEACEEAAQALSEAASALNVRLAPSYDASLSIHCLGDRKATYRIITNLLSNAIKHSPAGAVVEIVIADSDVNARVLVRDSGPGIPPDEQSSIFDKFQQASTARSSRLPGIGSGLGLSICKTFAEKQGGTVEVASTVGSGSTFSLTMPKV